jgi:hypothetical protein
MKTDPKKSEKFQELLHLPRLLGAESEIFPELLHYLLLFAPMSGLCHFGIHQLAKRPT